MSREQYDLDEGAYQQILKERIEALNKKLAEEQDHSNLIHGSQELKMKETFDLTKRTYGVTKDDKQRFDNAVEAKKTARAQLVQAQRNRLIKEAEKQIEVKVFGKEWGRLEAREKAYGPGDALVVNLTNEKQEQEKQLQIEKSRLRPSLDSMHRLESNKGKLTERFNDKDRER